MTNYENWMAESNINGRRLRSITIPGSHDAGTYDMFSAFGKAYGQCQSVPVASQLRAGSRYLDLRAHHWNGDEKYYMVHGSEWANTKLDTVITDVLEFASTHPKELIIITLLLNGGKVDGKDDNSPELKRVKTRLSRHLVKTPRIGRKAFATMKLGDILKGGRNIILDTWGGCADYMDRSGVYYDTFPAGTFGQPQDTHDKLNHYIRPPIKCWIAHLNLAANTPAGILIKAEAAHMYYARELLGKRKDDFKDLNIVNLDFIGEFDWMPIFLNRHPRQVGYQVG